jgi:hypothetical protein
MTIDDAGVSIELKRIDYPADQTVRALLATRIDPTAKQTLAELYQGGPAVNRWVRTPAVPAVAAG